MSKGRVYIACKWTRKAEALAAKEQFEAAGYEVTAHWIMEHSESEDPANIREQAQADVRDIRSCDIFVFLNHEELSEGKSFELGLAYGWGKQIVFVGPLSRYNVFYYLPGVCCWQVGTVERAITLIEDMEL